MLTPDDLPPLAEAAAAFLTVQYAPSDGAESAENPPRFSWLPAIDEDAAYMLAVEPVEADAGSATGLAFEALSGTHNFYTPRHVLATGRWRWRYRLWNSQRSAPASGWSTWRSFSVPHTAKHCPAMDTSSFFSRPAPARPRLWLQPEEVLSLRAAVSDDAQHIGWQRFCDEAVWPWTRVPPPAEPAAYPDNRRVLALWRKSYMDCQELLYGVRHQAVAGLVADDAMLRANAKAWLLHVLSFDPQGTTSRAYNDESAFRIVAALAWGYDWLHDLLTPTERADVRRVLLQRMEEVAEHVLDHARIHLFPYDSHAVRAIGMVLIPGSIALLGEEPKAKVWLEFCIAYYDNLYSPWGGADGGWAEGPHYWTTAMAYYMEAAGLLRKFCGHDVLLRAHPSSTGDFPLYTKAPDVKRGTFCDDPTLGETVSLKVGQLMDQFASVSGNTAYAWYGEDVRARDPGTAHLYYNHGWWSLPFDELCHAHDRSRVAAMPPVDLPELKHFSDVGWVAVQRRLHDAQQHVQFVAKSSRFGSISHSHGDQAAFTFFAYGEDLAIQSGYYVGHNTSMHRRWRKRTISKNAILIDGQGQFDGDDKAQQIRASGRVREARTLEDGTIFVSMEATEAYRCNVPALQNYRRDYYLFPGDQLLVVDLVALDAPKPIQWLLHTLQAPQVARRSFQVHGRAAQLTGEVVFCSGGAPVLSAHTGFADVDLSEIADQPIHHHLRMEVPAARRHVIAVLLTPERANQSNRLFHFIDDQGFATHLYFNDAQSRSFSVTLDKAF
jgi:hypothetical protein